MVYLEIMCKIKEDLNKRVMRKERPSGKVVVLTKEEVILTEVVIEEEYLEVNASNVSKKDIEPLNVNILEGGMNVIMAKML